MSEDDPRPADLAGPTPKDGSPDGGSKLEPGSAHMLGLVDELPITWCPNCQADVKPKGRGLCPRCSRFLKGSFSARKHPINKLRRQQILERLIVDYRPQSTLAHASCEMLAGVIEQLEVLKPGSPEHQRLVQLSQTLGAALEESRPTSSSSAPSLDDLTPDQIVSHAEAVLKLALEARDAARQSEAYLAKVRSARPEGVSPDSAPNAAPRASSGSETKPEAVCQFCHQSPSRCADIKADDPSTWEVLHGNDPELLKEKDERRTREMFEGLRRYRS